MNVFNDLKNSFSQSGNGLNQIIIINVVVFVTLKIFQVFLTLSGNADIYMLISQQLFLPSALQEFIYKPWTLITYAFSHEDFFHIIFNMIFMYWFGMIITEFIGSKRFISLYVLGALAGGIMYLILYNTVPYFASKVSTSVLLGASGGVYAVVIGAATLLPDYTFYLLFLGPVRIKFIALFYVFLSFAQSIGPNAGGNLAHLGGALIGFVFVWQLRKGNDLGKPITWILTSVGSIFKPKSNIKITYRHTNFEKPTVKNPSNEDISQAEIDTILDKISKYGYEKLTKEEKQKLFKASQSANI